MNQTDRARPDTPPLRRSPEFSLYCVLALHAAWMLWIEQRAPAASILSCGLVATYGLWHWSARADAPAPDIEHPITDAGAAR